MAKNDPYKDAWQQTEKEFVLIMNSFSSYQKELEMMRPLLQAPYTIHIDQALQILDRIMGEYTDFCDKLHHLRFYSEAKKYEYRNQNLP